VKQTKVSRRKFIEMAALAAAGAATSSCAKQPAPTETPKKEYPSPTPPSIIKFVYDNPPPWREQAARFSKDTGIQLNYEEVPFTQLHTRYQTSLLGGEYDFDVLHIMDMWVKEWGPKGLLLPLEGYMAHEMTMDYPTGVLDNLKAVDVTTGKIHQYGIPLYYWITNFYYRTDLFEEAGLQPPTTVEEMRATAKELKERFGVYGFMTGMGNPTTAFGITLRGEGKEVLTDGQPTFNNAAGLTALNHLIGLVKDETIDPTSFELTSSIAAVDLFCQGNVAMTWGAPPTFPMSTNPDKSKIVGKVGVALMPGGSVHRTATYHETGGRAIPFNAKDPDAAWEYIRWVTTTEEMVFIATDPGLGRVPARSSALNDPRTIAGYPLTKIVDEQLSSGPAGMVIVHEKGTEISEALKRHLTAALRFEKTPEQALADAEAEVRQVIAV